MPWTAVDILRLAIVALADENPASYRAPAAYLFGNTPDNEMSIIGKGCDLAAREIVQELIILGGEPYFTPGVKDAPLAYSGEKVWRDYLERFIVPKSRIVTIPRPPLSHTGSEAENLVAYAKERGWQDIYIVAVPFHMPRAFANTITQVLRIYPNLRVWCKPGIGLPYAENAIVSQGLDSGTRLIKGVEAEYKRLCAIWNNELDIASPEKIMDYILNRK